MRQSGKKNTMKIKSVELKDEKIIVNGDYLKLTYTLKGWKLCKNKKGKVGFLLPNGHFENAEEEINSFLKKEREREMEKRIDLFKEKRKGIAKTEYTLFERINNISDKLEELSSRLDDMSERLYELAKEPKEIFDDAPVYKEDFDEMFKESLKEFDKLFGEE